jgi:hypothetical protein
MFEDFKRLSFKHKNNKPGYYLLNNIRQYIPFTLYRAGLQHKLHDTNGLDMKYIDGRVEYYNQLTGNEKLSGDAPALSQFKKGKKQKTYFFDACEYTRYFPKTIKMRFLFGDITYAPVEPSIVKSRPIKSDIATSVVLNLDKIRHFLFIKDSIKFEDKIDMLVGRAKARQPHRQKFLDMYFHHPMCNIGQVNRDMNPQYIAGRMTIGEHLKYKFILCLEGNDVASNLKWVMSSNSLALMPKPQYETWFMEGTLIPDYHYVCIKDDYSDLEEKMLYYIKHTGEAQKIIDNAHRYIDQFRNKKQEDLISLLVLKKYVERTSPED